VSLAGVKYPLTGAVLDTVCPLGLSNEFAAEIAGVEALDGLLTVFVTKTNP